MKREILIVNAVVGLLIGYPLACEIYYSRSISPKPNWTVRDFFERFGEPQRVRLVQREGMTYYEFMGDMPRWWVLATPSAPPIYLFNEKGYLTEWNGTNSNAPGHLRAWQRQTTGEIEVAAVKRKFGLQ